MSSLDITCADCGTALIPNGREPAREWFMLRPEVWALTGLAPLGGRLCLGCTEVRIGRPLTGDDLTGELPINQPNEADSPRMHALKMAKALGRRGPTVEPDEVPQGGYPGRGLVAPAATPSPCAYTHTAL